MWRSFSNLGNSEVICRDLAPRMPLAASRTVTVTSFWSCWMSRIPQTGKCRSKLTRKCMMRWEMRSCSPFPFFWIGNKSRIEGGMVSGRAACQAVLLHLIKGSNRKTSCRKGSTQPWIKEIGPGITLMIRGRRCWWMIWTVFSLKLYTKGGWRTHPTW